MESSGSSQGSSHQRPSQRAAVWKACDMDYVQNDTWNNWMEINYLFLSDKKTEQLEHEPNIQYPYIDL